MKHNDPWWPWTLNHIHEKLISSRSCPWSPYFTCISSHGPWSVYPVWRKSIQCEDDCCLSYIFPKNFSLGRVSNTSKYIIKQFNLYGLVLVDGALIIISKYMLQTWKIFFSIQWNPVLKSFIFDLSQGYIYRQPIILRYLNFYFMYIL